MKEPIGPLGRIYTTAEAARALGIGRRKLDALLRVFPIYTPNGNRKQFNDDDIRELWKVKRLPLPPGARAEIQRTSFSGLETLHDGLRSPPPPYMGRGGRNRRMSLLKK